MNKGGIYPAPTGEAPVFARGSRGTFFYVSGAAMRYVAPFVWARLPVIFSVSHRSIYRNQGLLEATILHPGGTYGETPHKQRFVVAYLLQC